MVLQVISKKILRSIIFELFLFHTFQFLWIWMSMKQKRFHALKLMRTMCFQKIKYEKWYWIFFLLYLWSFPWALPTIGLTEIMEKGGCQGLTQWGSLGDNRMKLLLLSQAVVYGFWAEIMEKRGMLNCSFEKTIFGLIWRA